MCPTVILHKLLVILGLLVVVVVFTLTRMIKSVVTGQAPVTLEWKNTPGKNASKPKVVHVMECSP